MEKVTRALQLPDQPEQISVHISILLVCSSPVCLLPMSAVRCIGKPILKCACGIQAVALCLLVKCLCTRRKTLLETMKADPVICG